MSRADALHFAEHGRRIHQHAAGAEHQRLDDEGGRLLLPADGIERVERLLLAAGRRKRNPAHLEKQRTIGIIEHAARADRHRSDRIAVIGMLHHDDAAALGAGVAPESERHFERDLDARRAAVGKEDVLETGRRQGDEALARAVRPARAYSRRR